MSEFTFKNSYECPTTDLVKASDENTKPTILIETKQTILVETSQSYANRINNLESEVENLKIENVLKNEENSEKIERFEKIEKKVEKIEKGVEKRLKKIEEKEVIFMFNKYYSLASDFFKEGKKNDETSDQIDEKIDEKIRENFKLGDEDFLKKMEHIRRNINEACHPRHHFDNRHCFSNGEPNKYKIQNLINDDKEELKNMEFFMKDMLSVNKDDFNKIFNGFATYLNFNYINL